MAVFTRYDILTNHQLHKERHARIDNRIDLFGGKPEKRHECNHAIALGIVSEEELSFIKKETEKINELLKKFFLKAGLIL